MNRARFDQSACDTLAECIKQIELNTDAELVIVVRGRSGHYAHADYLFGVLVAFVVLLFVLFSPFSFHQGWVPIDIVVAFILGTFASSRSNTLRRLFSTRNFRKEVVRRAAAAMFYEAGIANTHAEMGVLVYLSLLERQAELIADRGVLTKVSGQEWNRELFELRKVGETPDPNSFNEALMRFGKLLASHIPPTGDNPNELPDMPRFELK